MHTRLPLVLAGLHVNAYFQKTACLYVCYGNKKQQKTHLGKLIGSFMDDDERLAFENHISESIAPFIKKTLARTNYTYNNRIDYFNNAPHPYLEIVRNDHQDMTDADIKSISNLIEAAIRLRNKQIKPVFGESIFHVYEPQTSSTETEELNNSLSDSDATESITEEELETAEPATKSQPTQRYNLRPRK